MPRPKIILFQPVTGQWERVQGRMPPIGLLSAVRYVAGEYRVVLIDQRLLPQSWESRLKEELTDDVLAVGFTATIGPSIKNALYAAGIVRSISSSVPLLWGGIQPSLTPEQVLRSGFADAVVIGEGERTFSQMCNALRDGNDLEAVPGLSFLKDNALFFTEKRPFEQMDHFPEVPFELVDMPAYLDHYRNGRVLPIETSRGCPQECAFCYNNVVHHRRFRSQAPDIVVRRIEQLKERFGLTGLYFLDDNFFANKSRALCIAQGIRSLNLQWIAHGLTVRTALTLTDSELKLLLDAGCSELGIGVESGSKRMTKVMNKDHIPEQVLALNRKLAGHPIRISYHFLVGAPTETESDVRESVNLLLQLTRENKYAEVNHVGMFLPIFGTPLYEQAVARGFVPLTRFEQWADMDVGKARLPWIDSRTKAQLEAIHFASLFLGHDRLKSQRLAGIIPRFFAALYRPVARWRLEKNHLGWMVEKHLANYVLWFSEKIRARF